MGNNWSSCLTEIRTGIISGHYRTEAAVSRGIVMRLLEMLGWNIFDPQIVYPEYPLNSRRVDYALCYPAGKPVIIIGLPPVFRTGG